MFVTARSRGGRVDVAEALRAVGGGGHTAAASAVVKDRSLDDVAAAVAAAVPAAVAPYHGRSRRALEPGPPMVGDATSVDEAALLCRRDGIGGVGVPPARVSSWARRAGGSRPRRRATGWVTRPSRP